MEFSRRLAIHRGQLHNLKLVFDKECGELNDNHKLPKNVIKK
jgi:hypothetical protein